MQISSPKWTKPRPKPLVVSESLFYVVYYIKCKISILFSSYFSDSKMDGLDDALVHQTKMHHESFLPISVGTSSAKASADIVTFFALAASTLKYYYHHYWTTRSFSPVLLLSSLWQQKTIQIKWKTQWKKKFQCQRYISTAHFHLQKKRSHFWWLWPTVLCLWAWMLESPIRYTMIKVLVTTGRLCAGNGCCSANLLSGNGLL